MRERGSRKEEGDCACFLRPWEGRERNEEEESEKNRGKKRKGIKKKGKEGNYWKGKQRGKRLSCVFPPTMGRQEKEWEVETKRKTLMRKRKKKEGSGKVSKKEKGDCIRFL